MKLPSRACVHRIEGAGMPSAEHGITVPVELENSTLLGGSYVKTGPLRF
ncbi:hypothetical protein X975_27214, partial [Stegodyphus mimosarum]